MSGRPNVPDLEWLAPDCPMCDKEVSSDGDSLFCEECEASWNHDGTRGEWGDAGPGCPSQIEWWNTTWLEEEYERLRHLTEQCILPLDHDGQHRAFDSWVKWNSDDPRVVTA